MKNHILGTLYGMAIADAMGMPPELWSRKRCLEYYGKITDFLDGLSGKYHFLSIQSRSVY